MIARICSIAIFGIAIFTSNIGYSQQNDGAKRLDHVNQILSQIQNQTGAAMPPIEWGRRGIANPFSRGTTPESITTANNPSITTNALPKGNRADQPGVRIGSETIKIDVGGKTFSIPRAASTGVVYSGVNSARNSPPVSGNVVGDSLGLGLKKAMAFEKFAKSMAEFKRGRFSESGTLMTEAVRDLDPNDSVLQHQSLVLFQNGKFVKSAAVAYDALRSNRLFDWYTVQSLYGDSRSYATAYLSLQEAVRSDSSRIELRFLLGYHHLLLGHNRHAADEFSAVQARLNNDPVVAALLRAARVPPTPPPAPVDR